MIEVLSSGGGTQSTAICALIVDGILPKPDYIVIADTGYEMPTTWQYLDDIVRPGAKICGLRHTSYPARRICLGYHRQCFLQKERRGVNTSLYQ